MKMNMKNWMNDLMQSPVKKAMPVLSFPSISLMGWTVEELINSSDNLAKGMKLIADRVESAASLSMMDLSLEAQAFGSDVKYMEGEIPTVVGELVTTIEEAEALKVPEVGDGRTSTYIEGIEKACSLITDRPVFAGTIGPFSLAGRLVGVSEAMILCIEEPEMVEIVLRKATDFLKKYMLAYKATGAHGVVMAEPLAGLLSPSLAEEFSAPYVKELIDAVQDDEFIVIYHNCGNYVVQQIDSIMSVGASGYHFGNSIKMEDMLKVAATDVPIMGNIDPSSQFLNGTPDSIYEKTTELLESCSPTHRNFIISSGCDIPPLTPWENIDSFFRAVKDYYSGTNISYDKITNNDIKNKNNSDNELQKGELSYKIS